MGEGWRLEGGIEWGGRRLAVHQSLDIQTCQSIQNHHQKCQRCKTQGISSFVKFVLFVQGLMQELLSPAFIFAVFRAIQVVYKKILDQHLIFTNIVLLVVKTLYHDTM